MSDKQKAPSIKIIKEGFRNGRYVVISTAPMTVKGNAYWFCRCDCGTVKEVQASNLVRHKSCGCAKGSSISAKVRTHGEGGRNNKTAEYEAWSSMNARCGNPKNRVYARYGGRGITVCDRWKYDYTAFLEDMGRRPSKDHSLDRINNNLGYGPDNCRWATRKEQCNNKGNNRYFTFRGETKTISQWSRVVGISPLTMACRLREVLSGNEKWTLDRAFTK